MVFNLITNPIDTTARFLTAPIRGEDSASIAQWLGRIGAISMIALFVIGVFAAQVPVLATAGVVIIPIAAIMTALFGLICVISTQSRNTRETIELEEKLRHDVDKTDQRMREVEVLLARLDEAETQKLDEVGKKLDSRISPDPQIKELKKLEKSLRKKLRAETNRAQKKQLRGELLDVLQQKADLREAQANLA